MLFWVFVAWLIFTLGCFCAPFKAVALMFKKVIQQASRSFLELVLLILDTKVVKWIFYTKIFKEGRRYFWVFVLWLIFSFGCFCAPFIAIAIAFPFTRNLHYMQRFIRAADRLCGAMLGFSGRQMISTELTHASRLMWMREVIDIIDPHHCEESAYEEGAYCRLSDRPKSTYDPNAKHQLGCK